MIKNVKIEKFTILKKVVESNVYYAVNQNWIELWKNYLYTSNRYLRKNFTKGYNPPPSIVNNNLLIGNDKTKPGLIKVFILF